MSMMNTEFPSCEGLQSLASKSTGSAMDARGFILCQYPHQINGTFQGYELKVKLHSKSSVYIKKDTFSESTKSKHDSQFDASCFARGSQ